MTKNSTLAATAVADFVAMTLVALITSLAVEDADATGAATKTAGIVSALESARDRDRPFRLRVACTGNLGARNVVVFSDRVAVWDDRLQLRLSPEEHQKLAAMLLEGGFASLLPEYGGKHGARGPAKAPTRISCAVEVEINGHKRRSQQFVDGYQSPELNALANALLDFVEPLARARGTGASSLADGLEKLAAGTLSPHALELNFTHLPSGSGTGTIVSLRDGTLSVRDYTPGEAVGPASPAPLERETSGPLVAALKNADIESLPVNLWSEDQIELRVRVLSRGRTVLARNFSRLSPDALAERQRRFDQLVAFLRAFAAEQKSAGGSRFDG